MPDTSLPSSLQRVVARYVRAFAPERILLFGSYAKGTNEARSDLDLLIVADLPDHMSMHLRRAHQLAADSYPPVDVVFATPEEIENATVARSPFLLSILGTGLTVYEKTRAG